MKRRLVLAATLAVSLFGLTTGLGAPVQAVQPAQCSSPSGAAETDPGASTGSLPETVPGPDTSGDLSLETDEGTDPSTE
ncbi:hypothetical protein, partial [Cellulomonas cellasea]|uniref:hypothetical protein n=1 Tax=Cellulomonas cellasea TaxID=43670 RepID=UPI001B800D44